MNKHHSVASHIYDPDTKFQLAAKAIVSDLFERDERRYWIDFTCSVASAYVAVSIFLALPLNSLVAWFCFVVGGGLVYRASLFVHEIVHLPSRTMRGFRRFWNLFAGVPMLVPSFSYSSHIHHHNSREYGTDGDGEYLPLASGTALGVVVFLSQIFFQPILVYLRFLVLTPISFLHPKLRKWTLVHASSLVINFNFENHAREQRHTREDTFWELLTWFRAVVLIGLIVIGVMPVIRLPKMLMMAMFVLTLNHIRTLAAHRYANQVGIRVSHLDQFLDSTNATGNWPTEILCPLGLRYHALHHLFPSIPYHNLGTAHKRLSNLLPEESHYHRVLTSTYDQSSLSCGAASGSECMRLLIQGRSSFLLVVERC